MVVLSCVTCAVVIGDISQLDLWCARPWSEMIYVRREDFHTWIPWLVSDGSVTV